MNGFLTLVLAPLVFSISGTLYLSSNHRFVTNPTIEDFNGTTLKEVEVYYITAIAIHLATLHIHGMHICTFRRLQSFLYELYNMNIAS